MDDSRYEIVTLRFNQNNIDEYDNDTLFRNIYNYWCLSHYLSIHHLWRQYAIQKLKENIIKKWPTIDFCNVNLFLELVFLKNKDIDPTVYFYRSEDHFEYLMTLKLKLDRMVCDRHLNINKKKENVLDSKMIIF